MKFRIPKLKISVDWRKLFQRSMWLIAVLIFVVLILSACGVVVYGICVSYKKECREMEAWEKTISVDSSDAPLKVVKFSFEEHEYLCFSCNKIPTIDRQVVHNPNCPCQKKEGE